MLRLPLPVGTVEAAVDLVLRLLDEDGEAGGHRVAQDRPRLAIGRVDGNRPALRRGATGDQAMGAVEAGARRGSAVHAASVIRHGKLIPSMGRVKPGDMDFSQIRNAIVIGAH